MPLALSLKSYQPQFDILQQALESPKGIRIPSDNPVRLRATLYYARAAERRHHLKAYPEDNVMHGRSFYDDLVITLYPNDKAPEGIEIRKPEGALVKEILEL